jgi:hypothetical protein
MTPDRSIESAGYVALENVCARPKRFHQGDDVMLTPTSGHPAPRKNPHSFAVGSSSALTIPLTAVPLRTLRRLRRRRL